jgi:hypothetical protein
MKNSNLFLTDCSVYATIGQVSLERVVVILRFIVIKRSLQESRLKFIFTLTCQTCGMRQQVEVPRLLVKNLKKLKEPKQIFKLHDNITICQAEI